jgi:hypothetical protein
MQRRHGACTNCGDSDVPCTSEYYAMEARLETTKNAQWAARPGRLPVAHCQWHWQGDTNHCGTGCTVHRDWQQWWQVCEPDSEY